jgi:Tfp pilus assembly protein PilX
MSTTMARKSKALGQDAGIALLTTLMLLFLMSSLLVGFTILLISNQQLAGANNDDVTAFYAAEAGMEQLTANLGNLFAQTYSPTMVQINALETNPPAPTIPGVTFTNGNGSSGYTISLPASTTYDSNGNPIPQTGTVTTGPYTGLTAFITQYTLTVNARTSDGREVKLQRNTQTVGIPAFSFGVFGSMDLSFFAGPNFNFGGRTHSNGNIWLASGATLTLADKTDAYADVIRTELENGHLTSSGYTGTVQITTNPGGSTYRTLASSEGSYDPSAGTSNSGWPTISTGASPTDYNHNLINGLNAKAPQYSTGAKQLNLAVALVGQGATQAVDLIRRPVPNESSVVTNERYYSQASLRILLSDQASDITNLPCISSGAPFDLSLMATLPYGATPWSSGGSTGNATLQAIYNNMVTNHVIPLPLAASGSVGGYNLLNDGYYQPNGFPVIKGFIKIDKQTSYGTSSGCGTWTDVTAEVLGFGYVGRNLNPVPQSFNGTTVNPEWYYAGGVSNMNAGIAPALPSLPGAALGSQNGTALPTTPTTPYTSSYVSTTSNSYSCPDPHPYAIIRLERVRDNPSSVYYNSGALKTTAPINYPYQSNIEEVCGVNASTSPVTIASTRSGMSWGTCAPPTPCGVLGTASNWNPQVYDFWPNVLFDTREGELRDVSMSTTNLPTLNGTMSYIEIDAKNLAKWFAGTLGGFTTVTGPTTKDPNNASNDFTIYISDRRGNYEDSTVQSVSTLNWPPLSYTQKETGEYGWNDIVNGTESVQNGCPSNSMDSGEDPNVGTTFVGNFYYYGAGQKYIHGPGVTQANIVGTGQLGIYNGLAGTAFVANSNCTSVPSYSSADNIWPMMVASIANAARENPPMFFRRAIKVVNGNNLTALGTCPGGNPCGLAIATENPAYIQGDYNANSAGGGFNDPNVGASINADAVTLLSNAWNDVNSFSSPYAQTNRSGATSYYRVAVLAGVTPYFPQPGGSTTGNIGEDYGTDGGVHNYLRYIENWGGQTLNYEGSLVEMFYSRQANGTFKCCNTVYSPPSRGYNFDQDFLNPLLLPPRTPLFRDVDTTGWTRLLLASQ